MIFQEIVKKIETTFGTESIISSTESTILMPNIIIDGDLLLPICSYLQSNDELYFDMLSCMTGIDLGVESQKMEIAYNFYSIPLGHKFCLKVQVDRNNTSEQIVPSVSSLSAIWRTADWHEREIYDLLGINFIGHPDLRRILLPADWIGHPLRKDYKNEEYYHQIKVEY